VNNEELTDGASTLPTWHRFMRPLLEVLSDGAVWTKHPLEKEVVRKVGITEAQQAEVLPSGQHRVLNRIGWAMSYLVRAKAIAKPSRAVFQITDTGRQLLAEHPGPLSVAALQQIPAFNEYVPTKGRNAPNAKTSAADAEESDDPTELIEEGIQRFEADAAADLIRRLQDLPPDFLEHVVVRLLNAMGYGGAEQRGRRLGGSGDGGVDGVIDEDALGLSQIYVQAKRYAPDNVVQRPELQGFVGALVGRGATQGVFVTTSRFSQGARDYTESIQQRVVLIDGPRLAELMIQYRVGVQVKKTYDVVEVDEDFFD